ncbi:MAG: MarR family winged helix-turn-helix transcriptional regulator [Bacteroidota bacterium]
MIANDLRRIGKLYISVLGQHLPPPHSEFMAETLLLVARKKTPVTVGQLIAHLENDKRTIIKSLNELISLGYVEVKQASAVRIDDQLILTPIGRNLLPYIEEALMIIEKKIADTSEEIDLNLFNSLLRKLEANLRK